MLKEFVEKIITLKRPETVEPCHDGRQYIIDGYKPVIEPIASCIEINTLSGLMDYIKSGIDIDTISPMPSNKQFFIHVIDFRTVRIISELFGNFKQREILVESQAMESTGKEQWMDTEKFIIDLNSRFVHSFDHGYLANLVSNLTQAASKELKDNGVTQTTVLKNGISMVQEQTIKNPVTIQPYRTFPEIDQPEIEYIFRLRGTNGPPECALFEAGGSRWKLETMHRIKQWIETRLEEEGVVMMVIA
jgi:hypothetical protein